MILIWYKNLTATILVTQVRKPPDIAESYRVTDARQHKIKLPVPGFTTPLQRTQIMQRNRKLTLKFTYLFRSFFFVNKFIRSFISEYFDLNKILTNQNKILINSLCDLSKNQLKNKFVDNSLLERTKLATRWMIDDLVFINSFRINEKLLNGIFHSTCKYLICSYNESLYESQRC